MQEAWEELLKALWRDVLDIGHVAADTSFMDVGGTSIAAEKIASRFSASAKIELSGSDILRGETIARIVEEIVARA